MVKSKGRDDAYTRQFTVGLREAITSACYNRRLYELYDYLNSVEALLVGGTVSSSCRVCGGFFQTSVISIIFLLLLADRD